MVHRVKSGVTKPVAALRVLDSCVVIVTMFRTRSAATGFVAPPFGRSRLQP